MEIDSQLVLGFLRKWVGIVQPLFSPVVRCQSFITREWVFQFNHIFREVNSIADSLANFAFSLDLRFCLLLEPLINISRLLFNDATGLFSPE